MDVQEMSPDPVARRRRRTAVLFMLLAAALATALFGDWLLGSPAPAGKSAMRAPLAYAKAKLFGRPHHGITLALGTPEAFDGKGGPEDPGAYIEEDKRPRQHGWNLAFGNTPIDGFAHAGFTLPGKGGIGGGAFGGFGGGSGGGAGGGGSGGMILNCTEIQALGPQFAGKFGCPPAAKDSNPQVIADNGGSPGGSMPTATASSSTSSGGSGGDMITSPASASSGGSETGQTGTQSSGGANQPVPPIPTAAVPEPASWLTLMAGFFFIGVLLRHYVARTGRMNSDQLEA